LNSGLSNDAQIEQKTCIPDVKGIELVTMEYAFKVFRGAPKTLYLGKARNSRLHHISKFISLHHL
jgi:hypothetical protein